MKKACPIEVKWSFFFYCKAHDLICHFCSYGAQQGVSINDKHLRKDHQAKARAAGTGQTAWVCLPGLQHDGLFAGSLLSVQGTLRAGRRRSLDGPQPQEAHSQEPRARTCRARVDQTGYREPRFGLETRQLGAAEDRCHGRVLGRPRDLDLETMKTRLKALEARAAQGKQPANQWHLRALPSDDQGRILRHRVPQKVKRWFAPTLSSHG